MKAAQLNTMRVLQREKSAGEVKFWIMLLETLCGLYVYQANFSNNLLRPVFLLESGAKTQDTITTCLFYFFITYFIK
jgi:hypothetical protein